LKFVTKELVTLTLILILAFLLLTHSTGFARGVSAMSKGYVGVIRAFQGRG
jgi:hypothetical protein